MSVAAYTLFIFFSIYCKNKVQNNIGGRINISIQYVFLRNYYIL